MANPLVWALTNDPANAITLASVDASGNLVLTGTVVTQGFTNSIISKLKIILTTAQLLALKTTPIQLVPPAGAGTTFAVRQVVARLLFGSAAFTLNAGTFKLYLGVATGLGVAVSADLSALLTQTTNSTIVGANNVVTAPQVDANVVNVPLNILNDGAANFTVGTGCTVELIISYDVVTF